MTANNRIRNALPRVELIFDGDCPNFQAAREVLCDALTHSNLPARWAEYRHTDPTCPVYAQHSGSPAVFINGQDIHPAGAEGGNCRLYVTDDGKGFSGVPSLELLISVLDSAGTIQHAQAVGTESASCCSGTSPNVHNNLAIPPHQAGRWRGWAALPAIFTGCVIPGICPTCWPVYAGLLSALGLGFLTSEKILLPVMIAALLMALVSFVWKAKQRRGHLPFLLGIIASGMVLYGEFYLDSIIVHYGGIALLLIACIWNFWPRRIGKACPNCKISP